MRFLYGNGIVKHNRRLGVTSDELVKLNMLCPNIVRLGFDLHGVSLTAAVSPYVPYIPPWKSVLLAFAGQWTLL